MGTTEDWQRVAIARIALDDAETQRRELRARASAGDTDAFAEVLKSDGGIAGLFAAWRKALEKAMR
jgi:hypothetical protein